MRYFPMFLDMAGRRLLLAGGGEQVAQKARLLTRSDAQITVMSEELIPELADLAQAGRVDHLPVDLDETAVRAAHFVFIATEDEALDAEIADHARAGGALVNVVDRPDQCDMITPALVDRDPVVVAIGTEGAAPVVGKAIKTSLEGSLSPRLGAFVAMLGRMRERVAAAVPGRGRLAFWTWAASGPPWEMWRAGDEAGATAALEAAIEAGGAPKAAGGGTMVETPETADLIPLRAVERLQGATTVIHGPGAEGRLLDLARRDAERMEVARCPRDDLSHVRKALEDGPAVMLCRRACLEAAEAEGFEAIAAAPPR